MDEELEVCQEGKQDHALYYLAVVQGRCCGTMHWDAEGDTHKCYPVLDLDRPHEDDGSQRHAANEQARANHRRNCQFHLHGLACVCVTNCQEHGSRIRKANRLEATVMKFEVVLMSMTNW